MIVTHGELAIIEFAVAHLMWRQSRFTCVVLYAFGVVHLALAAAHVFFGWGRPL